LQSSFKNIQSSVHFSSLGIVSKSNDLVGMFYQVPIKIAWVFHLP